MIRKRIRLAQNFIRRPSLVSTLIEGSSICSEDIVLEIGPGEGVITKQLAVLAKKVIAVEADPELADCLTRSMQDSPNVEVHCADFLHFQVRQDTYKIFANIPFNRTADILRKLLDSQGMQDAYLILQKEAAEKYSGTPKRTEVSVRYHPWFTSSIEHNFDRSDFEPIPSVEVSLLHVERRREPLLEASQSSLFEQFVRFGFRAAKQDLKLAYKRVFTYDQWKRLSKDLQFSLRATPSELTFQQWLGLFRFFLRGVSADKTDLVMRATFI